MFYIEYLDGEFRNGNSLAMSGGSRSWIHPKIRVDSLGDSNILWDDALYAAEGYDHLVWYSSLGAEGFSVPRLLNVGTDSGAADLASGPFGDLHVVWRVWNPEMPDANGDLAYRSRGSGGWGSIEMLPTTGNQFEPVIVCNCAGTSCLAFTDKDPDSGIWQVFFTHRARTEPGIRVFTNLARYSGGEIFSVNVERFNPGVVQAADQYVLLDAYGTYYWYPEWDTVPHAVPVSLPQASRESEKLLGILLPSELVAGGPFYLYAAICSPGTFDLLGDFSGTAFWFGE